MLRLANGKSYLGQLTIFKYYDVVCFDNEMKPKHRDTGPLTTLYFHARLGSVSKSWPLNDH